MATHPWCLKLKLHLVITTNLIWEHPHPIPCAFKVLSTSSNQSKIWMPKMHGLPYIPPIPNTKPLWHPSPFPFTYNPIVVKDVWPIRIFECDLVITMPPYMNANVPNEMQEVTKMKNARWLGRN
jgi:hypothetical protein